MWLADHMHAAPHAERRTQRRTQSSRVSRGGRSRSTESRVSAADQTTCRGLSRYLPAILLFARSLFFLSRHLSRQCLGVNIIFSSGRRRRRYV